MAMSSQVWTAKHLCLLLLSFSRLPPAPLVSGFSSVPRQAFIQQLEQELQHARQQKLTPLPAMQHNKVYMESGEPAWRLGSSPAHGAGAMDAGVAALDRVQKLGGQEDHNQVHKRLPCGVHRGEDAQHHQQVHRHAPALILTPPALLSGGCFFFFFDSSNGAEEIALWCAQGRRRPTSPTSASACTGAHSDAACPSPSVASSLTPALVVPWTRSDREVFFILWRARRPMDGWIFVASLGRSSRECMMGCLFAGSSFCIQQGWAVSVHRDL